MVVNSSTSFDIYLRGLKSERNFCKGALGLGISTFKFLLGNRNKKNRFDTMEKLRFQRDQESCRFIEID